VVRAPIHSKGEADFTRTGSAAVTQQQYQSVGRRVWMVQLTLAFERLSIVRKNKGRQPRQCP
jgi:hypothetical protein